MVNNMVDGTRRGAANSTFFTAFDLGIGFGMMGTGALSQVLGFNKTFSLFALVILVSLVLFLASTSKHYSKAVLGK